jgi:hypothetical protein
MTLATRRFAVGVVTGFVLAVSLFAACGGNLTEEDTLYIQEHPYLNGPGGTKYEVSIGKDASGEVLVTVTPVGR